MTSLPDPLPDRIAAALRAASPDDLHKIDQLAATLRDWFYDRSLDLRTRDIAQTALASLTTVYALLMEARAAGELDDRSWAVVNDVITSCAAAVTVTRAGAELTPRP